MKLNLLNLVICEVIFGLLLKSVVKVFVTASQPNYKFPYQVSKISKGNGPGAIIGNNRILTSAHVISDAKFIEVKKENDTKRYVATVKYISNQVDLAILVVEDKAFFDNTKALKISENTNPRDEVTVLGYPTGGNSISTTTGVISRIEYQEYVHSHENFLAIQIDAAINGGNSGGPVVNNKNELVGIAMMTLSNSSNIGYITPSIVINTFLEDIKDEIVDGFNTNGIVMQDICNDAQKKYYALEGKTGMLVSSVGLDEKLLKVNDIILEVDDKDIANDGTIKTKYGLINFNFIFDTKQIGQSVKLKILRDKKELTVKYTLKKRVPFVSMEFGVEPRYIVYGGFVFTPLSENLIIDRDAFRLPEMLWMLNRKTVDWEEAVITSKIIFPDKVNRGYKAGSRMLMKVNNTKVKSFKHLVEILDNIKSEFTVFEFIEDDTIVLNSADAKKSLGNVMKTYDIKSDRRVK